MIRQIRSISRKPARPNPFYAVGVGINRSCFDGLEEGLERFGIAICVVSFQRAIPDEVLRNCGAIIIDHEFPEGPTLAQRILDADYGGRLIVLHDVGLSSSVQRAYQKLKIWEFFEKPCEGGRLAAAILQIE